MSVADCLKKATNPPNPKKEEEVRDWKTVAESLLSPIKKLCKRGDASVLSEVFHYLSIDLARNSVISRYRALVVIETLFLRSSEFRNIVCSNIRLVAKSGDLLKTEATSSLPTLSGNTKKVDLRTSLLELQTKTKEIIDLWDVLFGDQYPTLRAMARYFRETLRLDMPNVMVST